MKKHFKLVMLILCAFVILTGVKILYAADNVLFFVNDPKELTLVDMKKLMDYAESYYRNIGLLNSEDVQKFYQALRNHGAATAGQPGSDAYVGLVLQDASNPANTTGAPTGVLVVKGKFDNAKVLEILKKHYTEHTAKTGHENLFTENKSGAVTVHRFALAEKDRELTIISFGDYSLFSSAKVGDTRLLKETTAVLQNNSMKANVSAEASVHYLLQPTARDRELLTKVVNDKYQDFKSSKVLLKRKGLKGFFARRFADHKVKFITESINELNDVDVTIYRMKNDSVNMKRVSVVSNFASEDKARGVKKNILNHLNDAIKGASHPEDKLGLSNIKVTADGTKCSIDTELGTEEEQLSCFALISSYVARSVLRQ